GEDVAGLAGELAAYGAQSLYLAEDAALGGYQPDVEAALLARLIEQHRPWAVWAPASTRGRDYLPRVAARLGLGLPGDGIRFQLDEEERLVHFKPAFGGPIVASIYSSTLPQLATVREGALRACAPDATRRAAVQRLDPADLPSSRTRLTARTL